MVTVPDLPPQQASYDQYAQAGMALGIGGALTSIAGAYYGLKAQQNQLRMEALNAEFAALQADIGARAAERDAAVIIEAGQQAAAWRGAQAAAEVGSARADAAARGVDVNTGSAAESQRAIRLAAEVDRRTIRTNAQLRANATREGAANMRVQSLLGRASAANMRASASSISPASGAIAAGLGGASSLLNQYATYYGRR